MAETTLVLNEWTEKRQRQEVGITPFSSIE